MGEIKEICHLLCFAHALLSGTAHFNCPIKTEFPDGGSNILIFSLDYAHESRYHMTAQ